MLPVVIVFVSDQYKTQGMFNKAFLENGRMLKFIRDCSKNKKMCDKAVSNYYNSL